MTRKTLIGKISRESRTMSDRFTRIRAVLETGEINMVLHKDWRKLNLNRLEELWRWVIGFKTSGCYQIFTTVYEGLPERAWDNYAGFEQADLRHMNEVIGIRNAYKACKELWALRPQVCRNRNMKKGDYEQAPNPGCEVESIE